jgi:thymidylate synthase (FAD)
LFILEDKVMLDLLKFAQDSGFSVKRLDGLVNKNGEEIQTTSKHPQTAAYLGMHQDYWEDAVFFDDSIPSETDCGHIVVNRLLKKNKGHFGPLEHAQLVLNVIGFPHSMMQQLRTHRTGISFDVQSFRYTGQRIVDVVEGKRDIKDVAYLRIPGKYPDRFGNGKIDYTLEDRVEDLEYVIQGFHRYAEKYGRGFAPEHCRSKIQFDIRQHFVLSGNMRTIMHLMDLRWKADAQLEIQAFSELLFGVFSQWAPQVAAWYLENRAKRGPLAP